jgi:tetratricopeptide (TPR) repeat protein
MDDPTLGRDDEAPTRAEPILKVPDRLGPCRLVRRIGSGGMATVYQAEMAEDRPYARQGATVAVKVLDRERFGGVEAVRRFLREASLGRSIIHPAVVSTLDGGTERVGDSAFHYLVLEYVEGRSLSQLIQQLGVVPEALLRDIALQAAAALAAVHEAGVVHRDVKPSNILITPDHQVKLMDLGIARSLEDEERLTSGGLFVGTALYASPEQLQGETVGPASDLYSLGVALFEAATGVQPFGGGGVQAVMRRHFEVVPVRASRANAAVSPFLEELIASLLAKEPWGRFASAGDLRSVLESAESSEWWREREGSARASRPRTELPGLRVPRETAVVGRDPELEVLQGLFAEARAGRGRTVLVEGEAGVGKSRLLDELVGSLLSGSGSPYVLYGSHAPGGRGASPGALAEGVVGLLGEARLESALGRYLTITPRLVPAFAAYLTGASAPAGADPLSAEAVHAVFCHLARALCAERPVVWIVEDLHFASADSRALLVSLSRIAHDQRLLLIATARPGLSAEEVSWLDRLETTRRLGLDRLSPREVIQLLSEALRSQQLAERLGGKIAVKSDGNPFFIFEMLRELKGRASLQQLPDGSYTASDDAERLTVPTSVRELLLAHVRDLGIEDRALLDVGAVQGFSFDPDLVARVRGLKRLAVLESLAAIERRLGVIRATGTGFEFRHHQLQEVIVGALPPLLRSEYHALLAAAYEERGGFAGRRAEEVPGEAAVFLAEHYLKGGRREQGGRVVLRALDHLASLYRNEALLELADLALGAIGGRQDPGLRCDLRLREAECLDLLGRRDAQRAAVDDAVASAELAGDPRRMARAGLARGRWLHAISDYRAAVGVLNEAAERARATSDQATESRAIGHMGRLLLFLGEHEQASGRFATYLELSRALGDRRGEAIAGAELGAVCSAMGLYDEASDHLDRSFTLAREIGFRGCEATALGALAHVQFNRGRYAQARQSHEQHLAVSREIGDRHGEAVALGNLGHLCVEEGRLEEAAPLLEGCLEISRALQQRHIESYALLYLGHLSRALEQGAAARSRYEDALQLCRAVRAQNSLAECLVALARLMLEQNEPKAARPLLVEAQEITTRMDLANPGPLPAAYLLLLDGNEGQDVPIQDTPPIAVQAEAHAVLFRLGGVESHLTRARELLSEMSSHLTAGASRSFWSRNMTARMLSGASATLRGPSAAV